MADKENVGDGITKCEGLGAYRDLQEVREEGRVDKIEAFVAFDERVFTCWDLAWVRREEVEVEEGRGGTKRYWLRLDG